MDETEVSDGKSRSLSISKPYPDYCQTLTITDPNGQTREMVFPKALDLDRPKRARTTFSTEQLQDLEIAFDSNPYLVDRERSLLASRLQLSETQIKVWFQNRRTKQKNGAGAQSETIRAGRIDNTIRSGHSDVIRSGQPTDKHSANPLCQTTDTSGGSMSLTQSMPNSIFSVLPTSSPIVSSNGHNFTSALLIRPTRLQYPNSDMGLFSSLRHGGINFNPSERDVRNSLMRYGGGLLPYGQFPNLAQFSGSYHTRPPFY